MIVHKTIIEGFSHCFTCNNVFVYSHTGRPLHQVGKGRGKISGGKSKTINRNKGVGGSCTRKGKETKLQSNSERDSELETWMEAQKSRKKQKTSWFLHFISTDMQEVMQGQLFFTSVYTIKWKQSVSLSVILEWLKFYPKTNICIYIVEPQSYEPLGKMQCS